MTLRATIREESGDDRSYEAATPQDIGELVEALAESGVDDADIEHADRAERPEGGPDHVLHAAVRSNGYGYLRYRGPISGAEQVQEPVVPVGHPKSSETTGTKNARYPATTGLELALFTEALHEFDATGELPTCLAWTTEARIEANAPKPIERG